MERTECSCTNLVIAPAGKVDVPVVQKQFDVANSMRQIKTDVATLSKSAQLTVQ